MVKQKGGVYKGKKRQRWGVYKGSKRQRGGNLAKKTKNKIIKSFAQAEAFITHLAKKRGKKINQIGGFFPTNKKRFWLNRRSIDKCYL